MLPAGGAFSLHVRWNPDEIDTNIVFRLRQIPLRVLKQRCKVHRSMHWFCHLGHTHSSSPHIATVIGSERLTWTAAHVHGPCPGQALVVVLIDMPCRHILTNTWGTQLMQAHREVHSCLVLNLADCALIHAYVPGMLHGRGIRVAMA